MAPVFACDLSVFTPEQRARLHHLVDQVFEACGQAEEVPNGFRLRFPAESGTAPGGGSAALALMITEWITLERLCCPCIAFVMEFESGRGPIAVRMTGTEGIKPFLLAEFKGRIKGKSCPPGVTPRRQIPSGPVVPYDAAGDGSPAAGSPTCVRG